MPELLEVERVRRQLAGLVDARRVVSLVVEEPHRHLVNLPAAADRVCGTPRRHGKGFLIDLLSAAVCDRLELVIHLGMSGRLMVAGEKRPAHVRAALTLTCADRTRVTPADSDTVRIWFVDPRRFGRFMVCTPGRYPTLPMLERIGPDLFDVAPDRFFAALRRSQRPVKVLILDQWLVAGVGNIYADEALWRARIRPTLPGSDLDASRATKLLKELVAVCRASLASGGTTFRDYRDVSGQSGWLVSKLQVHGRAGAPCACCAEPLISQTLSQRTTVWCPSCQT